jgi:hypothetical protein
MSKNSILLMIGCIVISTPDLSEAEPLPTSFTCQGRLSLAGEPIDGDADLVVGLFSTESGGLPIVSDFLAGVLIEDGLFTITPDFGAAPFNGDARWIEILIRSPAWDGTHDEPPFTTLTPRQPLSATPYALQTRGLFVNESGDRARGGWARPAHALCGAYPVYAN